MKRKILVLEFWGLGDLTFSTPLLRGALDAGLQVDLLGKEYAAALLGPSFPGLRFLSFDAPWSKYRGKYRLWRWNWPELCGLILRLRKERYDAVLSVRNDPRDHLLMRLIGVPERYGFPLRGSRIFLTHPVKRTRARQHKVEDWQDIGAALGVFPGVSPEPRLDHAAYRGPMGDSVLAGVRRPVLCIHTGARIAVRRWPEPYYAAVIALLRREFDFHLLLIPDPDGYGMQLAPLADRVVTGLSVPEMVDLLGRVDLLLSNDSGPGHVAASCGRPVIALFGPSEPDWFRPWGANHQVVLRDICPWRPCFDYCLFAEPYCMTKLLPEHVWPEIREHLLKLIDGGILPAALLKPQGAAA